MTLSAVTTEYNGTVYKSRLEARFAEFLTDGGLEFRYDVFLPDSPQRYKCDFLILCNSLYVEVKPLPFLEELRIFAEDIESSRYRWICVDQEERNRWVILSSNLLRGFPLISNDLYAFDSTLVLDTGNLTWRLDANVHLTPSPVLIRNTIYPFPRFTYMELCHNR